MPESESSPEIKKNSVLSGEWGNLTNPRAYLEAAKRGMGQLRKLLDLVEK